MRKKYSGPPSWNGEPHKRGDRMVLILFSDRFTFEVKADGGVDYSGRAPLDQQLKFTGRHTYVENGVPRDGFVSGMLVMEGGEQIRLQNAIWTQGNQTKSWDALLDLEAWTRTLRNWATAPASYAKQAGDETLHKYADRIKARAILRAGELVKQIATGKIKIRINWKWPMNTEGWKDVAEALACGFTFLTGVALFGGIINKKWKVKTDSLVVVFTLLTGASLYCQWSLGREVARETKRHDDAEVRRVRAMLKEQNDQEAKVKSGLEQKIADGDRSREAAEKVFAEQQAKTATLTQQLVDAQKQAAAAAAAAPQSSGGGGG
jgi:hypothetical protein